MSVNTSNGNLVFSQTDYSLPGYAGVLLSRTYRSDSDAFSMFGYGWAPDFVNFLFNTTGDITVNFGSRSQTFKVADGYANADWTMQLSFVGEGANQMIQVEDRSHVKWFFDMNTKACAKKVDLNGNTTLFEMKEVHKLISSSGGTNFNQDVFLPTKITYPDGRQMTFTYDSNNLCTQAIAPDGTTITYSYTDGLLTGVGQNNGQVLSYDYYTLADGFKTRGWLKKITYANGAEANITYNGEFGTVNPLRVVSVTGPLGYDHSYGYTPGSGDEMTTSLTDSRNNATVYTSQNEDRINTVTNALGFVSSTFQNDHYQTFKTTDNRGNSSFLGYDSNNPEALARDNLLQETNNLSKVWNFAYDPNNLPTLFKDPLGHANSFENDAQGNLLAITNALNQQTARFSYFPNGLLKTATDGQGNTTTFARNDLGLVTNRVDAAGNIWGSTYNLSGFRTQQTDPLGHTVSYAYNGFNKVSKITDALGQITKFSYDDMANLTGVTDPAGNSTSIQYNLLQRPTLIRDALGHETRLGYDSESNVIGLTNALGRAYSWNYDPVNQPKTFTYPDNSKETYSFDPNGNVTSVTRRSGQAIRAIYDAENRMTSRTWQEVTPTVFTSSYDDANRLTSLTRTRGVVVESAITNSFDAANRLLQQTQGKFPVGFGYDANGVVTNIRYPSGLQVKYSLDSLHRIAAISDSSGKKGVVASYEFDAAGRVTKRKLENGTECLYSYNDANQVTNITLRAVSKTKKKAGDEDQDKDNGEDGKGFNSSGVLQSFTYGYNSVGNRAWVKYKNGRGDVYQYDATYQVTGVKYNVNDPMVGYAAATNPSRTVTYAFDAMGNRTSVKDNLNSTLYTVNNLDQYTAVGANHQFQYNRNGCLTGDGTWTYEFDPDNRLIGASREGLSVHYGYDGYGRRISKRFSMVRSQGLPVLRELVARFSEDDVEGITGLETATAAQMANHLKKLDRDYVYSGNQIIEEQDGHGSVVAKYIYGGGIDRPVKVIKRGHEYFFQQDALGNVTALTDKEGKIVEQYTYDIYGKVTVKDGHGNVRNRTPLTSFAFRGDSFAFTGREFDAETGLYHYRARAYSPELGGFLQPDPIGFAGGDVNFYRYVANNPINWRDPFGLEAFLILEEEVAPIPPEMIDEAVRLNNGRNSVRLPDGRRVDLRGRGHPDPATNERIPCPHTHDPNPPHPAPYDELFPRGTQDVPRPSTQQDIQDSIDFLRGLGNSFLNWLFGPPPPPPPNNSLA